MKDLAFLRLISENIDPTRLLRLLRFFLTWRLPFNWSLCEYMIAFHTNHTEANAIHFHVHSTTGNDMILEAGWKTVGRRTIKSVQPKFFSNFDRANA